MSNIIKEIGKLCLRQDPNLPRRLTDSQRASAHQHPDIISAEQDLVELQKQVSLVHSNCRQVADSLKGIEHKRHRSRIRAMKLREERAALKEALRHYHSTADLDHMVAQLQGEKPSSRLLAPVEHTIADRNWLAVNLFLPVTDESFADIVETMSRLCSQSEGKGQRNFSEPRHGVNSLTHGCMPRDSPSKPVLEPDTHIPPTRPAVETARPEQCNQPTEVTEVAIPRIIPQPQKRLTTRTCLFCFGDPQRSRAQRFPTTASLRNHYRMVHFQYQLGAFLCPIPSCDKIVLDPNHFANHAVTVHKTDLGVRASIMKVQGRSAKPGTLIPFRL